VRLKQIISACIFTCALASPANAETFRIGRLLCLSAPRVGLVVGSTQTLRCVFRARGSARRYVYEGQIRRIGLDIGATRGGSLSWAVFA
jgi:hypothetical protein